MTEKDDGQELLGKKGRISDDWSSKLNHRDQRRPLPEPTDQALDLAELQHVDREGYQRKMRLPRVENMARNWDIVLADYILVSRRTDGTLWIIDGQHRVAAATLAGEEEIMARVFEGLSREEEADLFYIHSTERRNIGHLEKFHAGVTAGYPHLVEINAIVEKAGGRINRTANAYSGLNAPTTLEKIHRYGGPDLLREVLDLALDAFSELNGPAAEGPTLAALAFVLGIHGDEIDKKHLIRRLHKAGADGLVTEAKKHEAAHTRDAARYMAIMSDKGIYNHRIGEDRKIDSVRVNLQKIAPRTCTRANCERRHHARGLCRPHYEAWFDGQRRKAVDRAPVA